MKDVEFDPQLEQQTYSLAQIETLVRTIFKTHRSGQLARRDRRNAGALTRARGEFCGSKTSAPTLPGSRSTVDDS